MAICFYFLLDDAIANAGGTTIKYIDTFTNTPIKVSNVLGAIITDKPEELLTPLLFKKGANTLIFYPLGIGGSVNQNSIISIRVFYF